MKQKRLPSLDVLKEHVKFFSVYSLANGEMYVKPQYIEKPMEEGATPVGVFTRLSIAEEIERILNKQLGREAQKAS